MKTFTIKIDCDNDAFAGRVEWEIADILKHVVGDLERNGVEFYEKSQTLWDSNGNDVGRAKTEVK